MGNQFANRLAEESWQAYLQTTETVQQHRILVKSPRVARGLPRGPTSAVCGWAHTVVLTEAGEVFASGYSDKGQLGTGTRANSGLFVRCCLDDCIARLAAGLNHTLAATKAGQLYS